MSQFYLNDKATVQRCYESLRTRQPITISGFTAANQIRAFSGVVQAVQEDRTGRDRYRWRVTIRDAE